MVRVYFLSLLLTVWAIAQDPFVPLQMDGNAAVLDRSGARQDWARITNQRMEMSGKSLRVLVEGGGLTAVVLVRDVKKPRHAKPILTGKGDYAGLFRSVTALGFNRLVVRNPDLGLEWGARLERGKAILEN
ncbi:MAG: hypothetical protein P4L36_01665 [Holophaga sp.]|nr:hypothetical protein [Holophaga sp.]